MAPMPMAESRASYFCHQYPRLEAQTSQVNHHSAAYWHGTISGGGLAMDHLHVLSLGLRSVDEANPADEPLSRSPQRSDEESTSLVYRRVRRQVVARGLARQHGDPKTKEGHQKARSTRLQKQLAIIEEYHRTKAREEARLKKLQHEAELKRSHSATTVAPETGVKFARKISLRQLPPSAGSSPSKNQQDEPIARSLSSPQATDIEAYAVLASRAGAFSPRGPDAGMTTASPSARAVSSKLKKEIKGRRGGALDKSTAQVMCELKINKDIMMREHLVEQIHDASSALNKLAAELHDLSMRKTRLEKASQANAQSAGSGVGPLLARRSSINGLVSPPKKEKSTVGQEDAVVSVDMMEDLDAKLTDATRLVKRRMMQLNRLISTFQTTTIEVVETILEWRAQKSQRIALSNVDKLHRFPWKYKQHHAKNYLAHIDDDLRHLFPSATMGLVLGIHTKYNPMLLPRSLLESLGIPDDMFVSTTFLTERRELMSSRDSTSGLPRALSGESSSPTRRQAHAALYNTAKALGLDSVTTSHLDIDRLRRCLEAILNERELEKLAEERDAQEKQRQATAYNPFEAIKVTGGVEDTIASVLQQKPPSETAKLAEELRHRQEDTTRAKENQATDTTSTSSAGQQPALHVNPRRLRLLIEQRNEIREGKADCELRDTTSTWTKNKLKGQVMMRKMAIRRLEHQHASKIQRQFQAYRRRTQLLKNLTHFVLYTRHSVVSIQKLVRGFIAKRRYQAAKERHELQRRQCEAVKLMWFTYKRYKRRLRHRHSMSVESVAQIQLIRVLQHQLDESPDEDQTSSAERYRRVGEERRRQRAAQLLKKRQELLELEAKKIAAATRIQSVYRMHSAKQLAINLRGERRAHLSAVSAMMIQSKIRKFLKYQEKRRLKFRSDMERVNRSAVRIQSIYRGYNSRASLVVEFDDQLRNLGNLHRPLDDDEADADDFDEEDEEEEEETSQADDKYTTLPPIVTSRPSTSNGSDKGDTMRPTSAVAPPPVASEPEQLPSRPIHIQPVSLPPLRSRAQSVEPAFARKAQPPPAVRRQTSNAMMKVELRLKEPTLGDDFEEAAATSCSISSQGGSFRRRFSRSGSGSSSSDASSRPFKSTTG